MVYIYKLIPKYQPYFSSLTRISHQYFLHNKNLPLHSLLQLHTHTHKDYLKYQSK